MERARTLGGGRLAALLAAFAMIVQSLVVTPAQAANVIEICTPLGKQIIVLDQAAPDRDPHNAAAAGHCGACVLLAPIDASFQRLDVPVRYAVRLAVASATSIAAPAKARGPPRPFGQAPPAL